MDASLFIDGVVESRKHFHRHLTGMPDEAWDFKPYPECMSIMETLAHLIVDDRMVVEALSSGKEPNYDAARGVIAPEIAKGKDHLLGLLRESHDAAIAKLREATAGKQESDQLCIWGWMMPAYRGIPFISSEDFYHAGQVAYIRMAVQPDWNYYAQVFAD